MTRATWFGLLLVTFFATLCPAQAWLPAKGEGTVSITYQNLYFDGHYLSDGSKDLSADPFPSRSQGLGLGIDYGLTSRIAISAGLPYVFTKFTGDSYQGHPVVDDRRYHRTFQDVRFQLSGNLLKNPVVLTPFVAVVIPSHDYDVVGEAAPGRDLKEFQVGLSAGRLLTPVLPRAYVHARYTYAVSERFEDLSTNRSNLDTELGYFVSPAFALNMQVSMQRTHGGVTIDDLINHSLTGSLDFNHDRLLRANHQHIGAGAAYSLSPTMDVQAKFIRFLSGTDTHYGKAVIAGVSWTFGTKR